MFPTSKAGVALTSVVAAVGLTVFKLAVGLATGSLGLLAEAAHSGLDLSTNMALGIILFCGVILGAFVFVWRYETEAWLAIQALIPLSMRRALGLPQSCARPCQVPPLASSEWKKPVSAGLLGSGPGPSAL